MCAVEGGNEWHLDDYKHMLRSEGTQLCDWYFLLPFPIGTKPSLISEQVLSC